MLTDSSPAFDNCVFTMSSARLGGVMHALRSEPLVMSSTFVGNLAWHSGGAMYAKQSAPWVCTQYNLKMIQPALPLT